jgi:membrane protease YdiL (CAAX protease family)
MQICNKERLKMDSTKKSNPKSSKRRPPTRILTVLVGFVPVYAVALGSNLSGRTITLDQLFLYPLVFGGGAIVLILLMHRYVLGESLTTLQLKPGRWYSDILTGVILGLLSLGLKIVQGVVQSSILAVQPNPPAEEIITLLSGIAGNPMLMALWLGPVVWIGVAAFEELVRVFALNHLWRVWPRPLTKWLVIIGTAALFGLVHIYQAPLNMLFLTIQGLLYGWYYLKFGRVWPLIVAHAMYDSLQIAQILMVFQG